MNETWHNIIVPYNVRSMLSSIVTFLDPSKNQTVYVDRVKFESTLNQNQLGLFL